MNGSKAKGMLIGFGIAALLAVGALCWALVKLVEGMGDRLGGAIG